MTTTQSTVANPRSSRAAPVIVIGGGIGGLVAALELAARGVAVLMLERAATTGGKVREVVAGPCAMDAGPTVFTMRWVFDELFDRVGTTLEHHLFLEPLSVLARHAWPDGSRLDLHKDRTQSADAINDFAGAAEARGYLRLCQRAEALYAALDRPFLRSRRTHVVGLTARVAKSGLPGLKGLLGVSPFQSLWHELRRYFADPRLQQLYGRYATYCGSSPFGAAATLLLVAHVEQEGVWSVKGGMVRLARVLETLARERGAVVRCNTHVERIVVDGGRARGVVLAGGERIEARAVVFNGDVSALADGLLGPEAKTAAPRAPGCQRSLSALTLNLNARVDGFALHRHNVFFSRNYEQEFRDIFSSGRLPTQPTVYVCAQDRDDAAPMHIPRPRPVSERLLMIINAPALGDRGSLGPDEVASCQTQAFQLLQRCGLDLRATTSPAVVTTPTDFAAMFPGTGGALYGQASHGWQASFQRPGARSLLPGLYLAGGSVHPGPGVPMAALSGSQAAASVLADLALRGALSRPSTRTSPLAAMRGGTSMR